MNEPTLEERVDEVFANGSDDLREWRQRWIAAMREVHTAALERAAKLVKKDAERFQMHGERIVNNEPERAVEGILYLGVAGQLRDLESAIRQLKETQT